MSLLQPHPVGSGGGIDAHPAGLLSPYCPLSPPGPAPQALMQPPRPPGPVYAQVPVVSVVVLGPALASPWQSLTQEGLASSGDVQRPCGTPPPPARCPAV